MAEFVPADLPTPVVEIIPPAIDPRNPKNLGAPRDHRAPGAGVDRRAHRAPAGHPGLALRPLEGSAGRHRGLPVGPAGGARSAAGARRVDGVRRSGGLGHVPRDPRRDRRRQAHARLHEPGRRRQRRGQRLPGAVEGGHPEVAARGVRAGRRRGAVEGDAGRRGAGRRDPAADGRRDGRASWSTASRSARTRW